MPKKETAGDWRTDAQWIGDIAHRTLERLQALQPELETLRQQFGLLRRYADEQGMASASFTLERMSDHLAELAGCGWPDSDGLARAVLRGIVADTGRVKQPYHDYDG